MGRTPLNVLQQFRVASRSRLFASTQRHRDAILRFQNVVSVSSVAFEKAGEHRGTRPAEPRHGLTGGDGLRCKRSENQVRLSEPVLGSIGQFMHQLTERRA